MYKRQRKGRLHAVYAIYAIHFTFDIPWKRWDTTGRRSVLNQHRYSLTIGYGYWALIYFEIYLDILRMTID